MPCLSWGHPYPTGAPARARIRFPLLCPCAVFMPSAMLKLMFLVAGIAFRVSFDMLELNHIFRCCSVRSRCRCLQLRHRGSAHSLCGVSPFLKDRSAGTLGWRQQMQVPFLLSLLCCLILDLTRPRISVSFFVLLPEMASH